MVWDDLKVFLALDRNGSHAGAARALGVDPTTIGRRLAALEVELGTRLFDRTPAGLALSPTGTALLPHAERIEAEFAAAERGLQGADTRVAGTLRVTAGDGLATYVLVPALESLRQKHPALEVELRADTRNLDLSRREADIAVRLSRPRQPALVARRLGTLAFGLYASAAYLERRPPPRSARDLGVHEWIGFDAALDDVHQVRWLRETVPALRYAVRANTTVAQAVACAAGSGVALLPTFVTEREPGLVRLLPRLAIPTREAWVVTHVDMKRNARVAAGVEWLAGVLGRALGG